MRLPAKMVYIGVILATIVVLAACTATPASTDKQVMNNYNNDYSKQTNVEDNSEENAQTVSPEQAPAEANNTPQNRETPLVPQTPSGITSQELATHDSTQDCWVAYKGKVYDITDWLPKHPGGIAKISPTCGTSDEFASAFNRKHSTKQDSRLESEGMLKGNYLP